MKSIGKPCDNPGSCAAARGLARDNEIMKLAAPNGADLHFKGADQKFQIVWMLLGSSRSKLLYKVDRYIGSFCLPNQEQEGFSKRALRQFEKLK